MNRLQVFINKNLYILLSSLSLVATIYVIFHPLPTDGLDLYFLLPFVYAFVVFFSKNVLTYHIDGYGLKCFYIVTFVRYVILPFSSCYSGVIGPYADLPANYYCYGIFVSLIELVFSYIWISKYYKIEYNKLENSINHQNFQYYNDLGYGGVLLILGMIFVVVGRGHLATIIEGMRFLVVTDSFDNNADVWTYDLWAIQVFFAFVVVTITSYFKKRNDKKENILNIIIPFILVFLSCSLIFTNNRMTMVYYALCGLCVLNAAFPKRAKMISSVIISVMLIVIVSFTLMKNFKYEVGGGESVDVSEGEATTTLSAYVCGVDNIAHGVDMYMMNGYKYNIGGFFKTVHNFFMPSRLPFFNREFFEQYDSAVELATRGSEMVSVATEVLFWAGGPILGWLLEIFVLYIIIRLLILFEIHTKLELDLGKKYVYCWLSVLFGIFMCYCIQTLWNNTTYVPLYLTGCLYINRKFRLDNTLVK